MLFGDKVPRLAMFERVGAGKILEKPELLDQEKLRRDKMRQIDFLGRVLS